MLFLLFVIGLVVGIICITLGCWMCEHIGYEYDYLRFIGGAISFISAIAIFLSGIFMIFSYAGVNAKIAENQERYKSLTYQLENNLYDNDNDLGKKELYNEITEWNEDLAYYQNIQDDFWFGIYYPNIFDQFEFIEFE